MKMVAIAASALTADVFLQMTATLAHISQLQNTTTADSDKFPPSKNGNPTVLDLKRGDEGFHLHFRGKVNLIKFIF